MVIEVHSCEKFQTLRKISKYKSSKKQEEEYASEEREVDKNKHSSTKASQKTGRATLTTVQESYQKNYTSWEVKSLKL